MNLTVRIRQTLGKSAYWLKSIRRWLGEARILLWMVAALVGAGSIVLLSSETEAPIRIAGGVYQLMGILLAAGGLNRIRRLFGVRGPIEWLGEWLKNVPPWPRGVTLTPGPAVVRATAFAPTVHVGPPQLPTTGIDDQIRFIWEQLLRRDEELGRRVEMIGSDLEALERRSDRESLAREEGDRQLHSSMRQLQTSDLGWAALGLLLLATGVVLSSFAQDLVKLVD